MVCSRLSVVLISPSVCLPDLDAEDKRKLEKAVYSTNFLRTKKNTCTILKMGKGHDMMSETVYVWPMIMLFEGMFLFFCSLKFDAKNVHIETQYVLSLFLYR